MGEKGIVPSAHFAPMDRISWPTLIVLLLIVLSCQRLADGTDKFSPPGAGQNEVAQMRTFEGGQQAANSRVPSSAASNWEGSGANPDDEDGDVDEEGSGDGPSVDGSGSVPTDDFGQRAAPNESVAITDTRYPAQFGDGNRRQQQQREQQYANTTTTVIHLHSMSPVSVLSTTRATPPTVVITPTTVVLATTLRPPLMKPTTTKAPTTRTPLSSSAVSKASSPKMGTPTTVPKVVKPKDEAKWPQTPVKSTAPPFTPTRTPTKRPSFISDPSGTLEQLRPGIFAFMVGGVVVGLLLLILIISYLVYRLKKRDEGTYICEEPHQQSHYPYAYQKASIREFYA